MAPSRVDSPRLGLLLAALLMICGGLLRGWAASWGFISDEICWIHDGGVGGNWATGETAVNPPLLRMLVAAITTDHWLMLRVGRAWSVVASTAAIGLMFWLGRLVGQDKNAPGVIAAAYLALLPLAIKEGGWYRSYATLLLVLTWHLIALVKVADRRKRPPQRSWIIHLVASAALLPQVHYVGVAILFLEGLTFAAWLRDVRFIRYYLPAALLFAPLGARIVAETSEHLPADPNRLHSLYNLFNVAAHHPWLTGLIVGGAFFLRRRQRIVLLAGLAASIGLVVVASYHLARLELGIVPATYLIPLIAALPAALPSTSPIWRWARTLGWLVVAWSIGRVLYARFPFDMLRPQDPNGPPLMAQDVEAGNWPADRPTYLQPPHGLQPLHLYLEHRRLLTRCPVDERIVCFEYRNRVFLGFENRDLPPSYVVVFFESSMEDVFGGQCRLTRGQPLYWVWDCPNGWKAP